jgi:hypothetical protein
MTPVELQRENAALREQLAAAIAKGNEALDLAVEVSTKYDEAVNTVTALAGAAIAQKDGAPPAKPAPAPPPPPEPPPPTAPASFNEFLGLPSAEKAKLRAFFGDDLEVRLFDEKMHGIRLGLARGRASSAVNSPTGGGGHIEPAYRAEDFRTPLQISRDHAARMNAAIADPRSLSETDRARLDSLNSPGSPGRRSPAPSSSVPFTPTAAPKPAPGQKARHVAGGGGFAVRTR